MFTIDKHRETGELYLQFHIGLARDQMEWEQRTVIISGEGAKEKDEERAEEMADFVNRWLGAIEMALRAETAKVRESLAHSESKRQDLEKMFALLGNTMGVKEVTAEVWDRHFGNAEITTNPETGGKRLTSKLWDSVSNQTWLNGRRVTGPMTMDVPIAKTVQGEDPFKELMKRDQALQADMDGIKTATKLPTPGHPCLRCCESPDIYTPEHEDCTKGDDACCEYCLVRACHSCGARCACEV